MCQQTDEKYVSPLVVTPLLDRLFGISNYFAISRIYNYHLFDWSCRNSWEQKRLIHSELGVAEWMISRMYEIIFPFNVFHLKILLNSPLFTFLTSRFISSIGLTWRLRKQLSSRPGCILTGCYIANWSISILKLIAVEWNFRLLSQRYIFY